VYKKFILSGEDHMDEKSIVYGFSPIGLLFIPENRAKELANFYKALTTATTWGEFKEMVTKRIYEFYFPDSMHYDGPELEKVEDLESYYIQDETPFTPNDIFGYDNLPGQPEIEMSTWIPDEIQEKFGRRFRYLAMDMNVPGGEGLELDESRLDEIVKALEASGFECRRDDDLILAATTSDFDPDEFDWPEE